MADEERQPKLTQVLYNKRFGMLAFFENGLVAQMVVQQGTTTWRFKENIWQEAMAHERER